MIRGRPGAWPRASSSRSDDQLRRARGGTAAAAGLRDQRAGSRRRSFRATNAGRAMLSAAGTAGLPPDVARRGPSWGEGSDARSLPVRRASEHGCVSPWLTKSPGGGCRYLATTPARMGKPSRCPVGKRAAGGPAISIMQADYYEAPPCIPAVFGRTGRGIAFYGIRDTVEGANWRRAQGCRSRDRRTAPKELGDDPQPRAERLRKLDVRQARRGLVIASRPAFDDQAPGGYRAWPGRSSRPDGGGARIVAAALTARLSRCW